METGKLFPPPNYKEVLEQLRAVNEARRKDNKAYPAYLEAEEKRSRMLFEELNSLQTESAKEDNKQGECLDLMRRMMADSIKSEEERRRKEAARKLQAKEDILRLNNLRTEIDNLEDLNTEEALTLISEAMWLCATIANDKAENRGEYSDRLKLVEPFLFYVNHLLEFEHMVDAVQGATSRMAEALDGYPRQKLKVMNLRLEALLFIENREMHSLGITEDLCSEISFYQNNIDAADSGNFDAVIQRGFDKRDPIEWTEFWEDVSPAVDEYVSKNLECRSRRMGFCHVYWSEFEKVMMEKFGVKWRSPVEMNPGTHYD